MKEVNGTLITNARICTPDQVIERGGLLIKDGKIAAVLSTPSELKAANGPMFHHINLKGKWLSPGFIDIQINGGYKHYFSKDPNEESLIDIDKACRDYGVLHYLPTLISSPKDKIIEAIKAVKAFKESRPQSGILGMHLEGPFLNPLKKGAHNAQYLRKPTDEELTQIIEHGRGIIKVMTIAPELFTDEQIKFLISNKIILSAGHSAMNYEMAMHYFDLGINMVTHLFNAMSSFSHRSPNLTGAALVRSSIWGPVILDNHHLHPASARIAYQLKPDHLLLITDSTFLGRKVSEFSWEDFNVHLQGETYVNQEGHLAGSAISMVEALQNSLTLLPINLEDQAVALATANPARALNLQDEIGYIRPEYPAKFCVFDDRFENIETLVL